MEMERRDFLDSMYELLRHRNITFIGDSMVDVWRNFTKAESSPEGAHLKISKGCTTCNLGGTANIGRIANDLRATVHLVTGLSTGMCDNIKEHILSSILPPNFAGCKDMHTELSIKERIQINGETLTRIDRDCTSVFDWKNRTFVREVLASIRCAGSSNIVIQDYGKGCVTDMKRIFPKLRKENKDNMFIYGPHITSKPWKIGADIVKMNHHEYTKWGFRTFLEAIKFYGVKTALIVTEPTMISCWLVDGNGTLRDRVFASGLYVERPNVAGAGDVVMGLISKICREQWETFTHDQLFNVLKLIVGLASLKCDYNNISISTNQLVYDYLDRHVEKNSPGDIIGLYSGISRIGLVYREFLGQSIILINGTFDILHPGHFALFEKALEIKRSEPCAPLVVAINSDKSFMKLKKHNPTFPEDYRVSQIAGIKGVDYVIPFTEEGVLDDICKQLKPIMIKGDDYMNKRVTGQDHCQNIIYVPRVGGFSSTKIRSKNAKAN